MRPRVEMRVFACPFCDEIAGFAGDLDSVDANAIKCSIAHAEPVCDPFKRGAEAYILAASAEIKRKREASS